MEKSAEAFRTIAEVAQTLGVAQHVLRFWEQRFPQVAPVKRAGGRRYYRPADLALLAGLKAMLHDEGLTIRGAQKRLAEDGLAAVQAQGSDWLAAQGAPAPAAARRAPASTRRAAPKAARPARPAARADAAAPDTTAEPQPEMRAAMPAEPPPALAPSRQDSPDTAPQPVESPEAPDAPRRHPRRPAEPTATLPLFPELEPTPELAPQPAPHSAPVASRAAPRAVTEAAPEAAPRYADPMAERLARLTAALRRCDALAGDGPLAPDLAGDLAALARDLRRLADQAATLAAASA